MPEFSPEFVRSLLTVVDLLGVLANAFLGGMAARRARLDLVGFVVVAVVSGLGGGMIRDALLGAGPAAALLDPWYVTIASLGAFVAYRVPFRGRTTLRTIIVLDAVSVGAWSAVGVQKGVAQDLPWVPAVGLGILTVVGGGMVRDLLLQRRPAVFGGNTLYATAAFAASLVALVLTLLGRPVVANLAAIAVGAALVLAARRYRWMLPQARGEDAPRDPARPATTARA